MRKIGWLCLILIPVLGGGCARSTTPEGPEAVFLIVVDTLRPDGLSCYGSPNETPHINKLAESGVMFTQAQSAASWTVPSMGAMLTSRYPTQLGLVEEPVPPTTRFQARGRRTQLAYTLPLDVRTLAEILRDNGFQTSAFVNQPFINHADGFIQGFDEWCYPIGEGRVKWHDTSQPIPPTVFPGGTELGQADSIVVEAFTDWLERGAKSKPFVWLHLLKPHWPYRPPERYMADCPGNWGSTLNAECYDGEIRAVDDLIGQVLTAIDRHIGLTRSLVMFTSDHGEAFGEHGGIEHGHSLHREVVDVPLIIASPGLPTNLAIDGYARTIDLLPTILELAGVEATVNGLEGTSLMPLVSGAVEPRVVFAEGMLYGGTERSLVLKGHKLIYEADGGDRYRLFNLSNDPYEENDIARQSRLRTDDMRLALEGFHRRLLDDYLRGTGNETPAPSEEDERVLRALKALGYIGGDE